MGPDLRVRQYLIASDSKVKQKLNHTSRFIRYNKGKTETKNEDIKNLADYFAKENPEPSYKAAVKMAESVLNI